MRYLVLCLGVVGLSLTPLHGSDDSDKLVYLGGYFASQNGRLKISLSQHWLIWLNGERQFFGVGVGHEVSLKPGDILITGDGEPNPYGTQDDYGFYGYRLDKLTQDQAFLTVWSAPVIREQLSPKSCNMRPGEFVWKEQIAVNLPVVINDDSEVNGLQLGVGKPTRTK